jgi:hypothetical protein
LGKLKPPGKKVGLRFEPSGIRRKPESSPLRSQHLRKPDKRRRHMSTLWRVQGVTTREKARLPKLLLLALLVSLSGCASQSPPLGFDPMLVDVAAQERIKMHENYKPLAMPRELMKPPQESGYYSLRAEQSFRKWRESLTSLGTK